MSIPVKCPGCGKAYKLRDELAGKRVKCKCGQGMIVPSPAAAGESDDSTYDLAPMEKADPVSSLLDEEMSSAVGGPGLGGPAAGAAAESPQAVRLPPMKRTEAEEPGAQAPGTSRLVGLLAGQLARRAAIVGGSVVGLVVGAVVMFLLVSMLFRGGFSSPEDAFAAHQQAFERKQWKAQFRTYSPESQEQIAGAVASTALAMAESSAEIKEILKKYGIEEVEEPEMSLDAAPLDYDEFLKKMEERERQMVSGVKNKAAFFNELVSAIHSQELEDLPDNPAMRIYVAMGRSEARHDLIRGKLTDLEIDGDEAHGYISIRFGTKKVETPIAFKRIKGRWFIHTPGLEDPSDTPFSSGGFFP